jgi:hypothetical protein
LPSPSSTVGLFDKAKLFLSSFCYSGLFALLAQSSGLSTSRLSSLPATSIPASLIFHLSISKALWHLKETKDNSANDLKKTLTKTNSAFDFFFCNNNKSIFTQCRYTDDP